jgi:hypothetical protein
VDIATYKHLLSPHGEAGAGLLPSMSCCCRAVCYHTMLHAGSAVTDQHNLQVCCSLHAGFACVLEEPVPPEMSHPGRGSKECLLVFERR